jgi:hypothetical protein
MPDMDAFLFVCFWLRGFLLSRGRLAAENLALRQQLAVLRRPRLRPGDRLFWAWLSRWWVGWKDALVIVTPATVVGWHRQGFRLWRRWKSRGRPGRPRIGAAERDEFVEEFVQAIQEVFPGCRLHFEDWAGVDAMRLLARYRDRVCCYNDDIQGTAGVALAGILSALRVTGGRLRDQRVLFLGAGSAGIGIADLIASAMTMEELTEGQARARISLFDVNGLIEPSRTDLFDFQKPYAHAHPPSRDFVAVIESLKPTAIMGVSTKGKTFTRQAVGRGVPRLRRIP